VTASFEAGSPRHARLAEELDEAGLPPARSAQLQAMLLEEIDLALRPEVHERRVPSSGTILDPRLDPDGWSTGTQLDVARTAITREGLPGWRRFVDGLSSWLLRRTEEAGDEWVLFDRPAGSERDLVVLADASQATIVQRHPAGVVRVVGAFGVLRFEGLAWHHEPPVDAWAEQITSGAGGGGTDVVEAMLRLAVHDLGSSGVGALLVYRPSRSPGPPVEELLVAPPPLRIRKAAHLAPLRQALSQIDGAAIFDADGVLRRLGVRLVPSAEAEREVPPFGGTRHTSARRYSHDDPTAVVVVVSEDGPVSVLRGGKLLSPP